MQIQVIVLRGRVLCTTQSAFCTQGAIASQGLTHSLFIHACLLGHSLSSLHPGSSMGTRIAMDNFLIFRNTRSIYEEKNPIFTWIKPRGDYRRPVRLDRAPLAGSG